MKIEYKSDSEEVDPLLAVGGLPRNHLPEVQNWDDDPHMERDQVTFGDKVFYYSAVFLVGTYKLGGGLVKLFTPEKQHNTRLIEK